MLQRIIGVSIGALITFLLLIAFDGPDNEWRFVGDATQAYLVASIIGAIASFFWPIVIGWWLARRARDRREDAVSAEVERQLAEQQHRPPSG